MSITPHFSLLQPIYSTIKVSRNYLDELLRFPKSYYLNIPEGFNHKPAPVIDSIFRAGLLVGG